MLCYSDANTDPYFNLAAEEFLLTNAAGPIFRLWRNSPSVIIGRNQNAMADINTDYVKEHKIPVIRRLTGGGAVFPDLGKCHSPAFKCRMILARKDIVGQSSRFYLYLADSFQ